MIGSKNSALWIKKDNIKTTKWVFNFFVEMFVICKITKNEKRDY